MLLWMNNYFFSFIFNKLIIIMHNFINDGLLILFTILASKDNFQITDVISKSSWDIPTQKSAGIRSDSFSVAILRKWRRIWKIRNMGFVQNGPN